MTRARSRVRSTASSKTTGSARSSGAQAQDEPDGDLRLPVSVFPDQRLRGLPTNMLFGRLLAPCLPVDEVERSALARALRAEAKAVTANPPRGAERCALQWAHRGATGTARGLHGCGSTRKPSTRTRPRGVAHNPAHYQARSTASGTLDRPVLATSRGTAHPAPATGAPVRGSGAWTTRGKVRATPKRTGGDTCLRRGDIRASATPGRSSGMRNIRTVRATSP